MQQRRFCAVGWHNWLMSCSLLQLHSPTLLPYPSFLSSSMAVDGLTAKAGGAPAQQQHLSSVYQAPHGCWGLSAVTGYQEQFLQLLLILYSQGEASVLHSLGGEEWKWFCCVLRCTAWISCILWDTYCRVPWSLQCHSDEHVAQTTWQFPYQFLRR